MKFEGTGEKYEDECVLQVLPMIDICFLLLTFLMLGANFRIPEGELESNLPDEGGAATKLTRPIGDVDEIRVTVRLSQAQGQDPNAEPSILIDGKGSATASGGGGIKWLETELKRLGGDKRIREEVPVIIEAEPRQLYRWVIKVLDLCRQAQFTKVNFAASKRGAPPVDAPAPAPPG